MLENSRAAEYPARIPRSHRDRERAPAHLATVLCNRASAERELDPLLSIVVVDPPVAAFLILRRGGLRERSPEAQPTQFRG